MNTKAERRQRLMSDSNDNALRLIYMWIKSGVMSLAEFNTTMKEMKDDSFEAGRRAGLDGQDGPDS